MICDLFQLVGVEGFFRTGRVVKLRVGSIRDPSLTTSPQDDRKGCRLPYLFVGTLDFPLLCTIVCIHVSSCMHCLHTFVC